MVGRFKRTKRLPGQDFFPRSQRELIKETWQLVQYLRKDERLTQREVEKRLNLRPQQYKNLLGTDIRLSTLAEILHVFGKKVKLVVEDEV